MWRVGGVGHEVVAPSISALLYCRAGSSSARTAAAGAALAEAYWPWLLSTVDFLCLLCHPLSWEQLLS